MPLYKYRAKDGPQKLIEDTIEAPNKDAAVKLIEDRGHFPVKVEEIIQGKVSSVSRKVNKKVKAQEVIIFSRQLATLIRAGIPILKALGVLSEQTQSENLSEIIKQIHSDLKEGSPFSEALARHPKAFSAFYVAMIQAGEDSARLQETLTRLAGHYKSQQEIISKVKLALIYPFIMGSVGLGTIVFMFTFVMPRLMGIFASVGQNLPLPTKILIAISKYTSQWGWLMLIGLVLVALAIRYELQTKAGKRALSTIQLRLPLLGDLLLKKELAILSRTLEMLIKSGIPILKVIELTIPIIGNEIIREHFSQGYIELKQGSSLGKTLKRYKVFPVFMTNLITVGEESGKLDIPLAELANAYEKDTEDSIKAFTAILEPVMILGMGLVVGFIVMAMLLPIFEVNIMVQ